MCVKVDKRVTNKVVNDKEGRGMRGLKKGEKEQVRVELKQETKKREKNCGGERCRVYKREGKKREGMRGVGRNKWKG